MKNNSENKRGELANNYSLKHHSYIITEGGKGYYAEIDCGEYIETKEGQMDAENNANDFCKCVNAYDDLVAALQIAQEYVMQMKDRGMIGEIDKDLDRINSALAKATGTPATNFDYMAH